MSQILNLIDQNNLSPNSQAALLNLLAQNRTPPPSSSLAPQLNLPLGFQTALGASGPSAMHPGPGPGFGNGAGIATSIALHPGNSVTGSLNHATAAALQAAAASASQPLQQIQESIQLQVKRMRFTPPQDHQGPPSTCASKPAFAPNLGGAGILGGAPGQFASHQRSPFPPRCLPPSNAPQNQTPHTSVGMNNLLVTNWKSVNGRKSPIAGASLAKAPEESLTSGLPPRRPSSQNSCYGTVAENLYDPAQPTPAEDLEITTAIVQQNRPGVLTPAVARLGGGSQSLPPGQQLVNARTTLALPGIPLTTEDLQQLAVHQEAARMENLLLQLRNPGMYPVAARPNEQAKPDDSKKKEYCTVCSCYLDQPLLLHRRSKEHKKKKEHMYPRCRKCNIRNFENRAVYEEHCKSEEHRKACEAWALRRQQQQQQQDGGEGVVGRHDDDDNDADDASPLMIGAIEGAPENLPALEAPALGLVALQPGVAPAPQPRPDGYTFEDYTPVPVEALEPKISPEKTPGQNFPNKISSSPYSKTNSSEPVGQEFIVAMTGYYCKLCNKFYHDEEQAKIHHCMSTTHLTRYQDLLSALSSSLLRGSTTDNGDVAHSEATLADIQLISGQKSVAAIGTKRKATPTTPLDPEMAPYINNNEKEGVVATSGRAHVRISALAATRASGSDDGSDVNSDVESQPASS